MARLTDMQLVLLTTAAQRPDGSLLPPAESLCARADRIYRSVQGLVTKALAAEADVRDRGQSWRTEGDRLIGVVITDAGRVAIGVEPAGGRENAALPPPPAAAEAPSAPRADSKIASVVSLLQRPDGATLPELVAATGWLPHTTRAALTGLRKKGHAIVEARRGEATCYSIAGAA